MKILSFCLLISLCSFAIGEDFSERDLLDRNFSEFCIKNPQSSLFKIEAVTKCFEKSMQYYLERAKLKREFANYYLKNASAYTDLVPEINIKEQIKTLINSSIGTILIPDPKTKIFSVVLALIGDLVNQLGLGTYQNYRYITDNLNQAICYIEECNCLNRLALSSPIFSEKLCDNLLQYGRNIELAIQYLIVVEMHTTAMESKIDGIAVSSRLFNIREAIILECEQYGMITTKHSHKIEGLCENLPEIFSDFSDYDRDFYWECDMLLYSAQVELESIEKALGIK